MASRASFDNRQLLMPERRDDTLGFDRARLAPQDMHEREGRAKLFGGGLQHHCRDFRRSLREIQRH